MAAHFTKSEMNLIYQFGGEDNWEKADMLKSIELRIEDEFTKMTIGSTIHKLSVLSETSYSELVSNAKNRKLTERDSSIRNCLAKIAVILIEE